MDKINPTSLPHGIKAPWKHPASYCSPSSTSMPQYCAVAYPNSSTLNQKSPLFLCSGTLRTGKGKNSHKCKTILDADISTCEWHVDKVKISAKSTGHKNIGHALRMTSQTLWLLPKRTHYGALSLMRRSTSMRLEPALTASTLSKQAKLTFHRIALW